MPNVILFIRSNPVNPDSRVEKEVYTLLKAGYNVEILAWDRNSNYPIRTEKIKLNDLETVIHRVGIKSVYGGGVRKNLIPLLKFQFAIRKFINNNKVRISTIHACDFDTAFTAYKVSKNKRIRFIYDIFDYYVDSFSVPIILKNYIEKKDIKIINNANAVIICSEQRLEQIKKSAPQNIFIIHNTPPLINLVPKESQNTNLKISYVGILSEGRYLKEISEFVIENPSIELHIAGFGQLHDYFKNVSEKHSNINFYGKVEYEQGINLSNSSDIMMAIYNPNSRNNYYAAPNKFYEALMLGKPIIMANNTGFSNVVADNEFGLIIDYNKKISIDSLVEFIKRFKENKTDYQMKEMYEKKYNWQIMSNRLLELYKKI